LIAQAALKVGMNSHNPIIRPLTSATLISANNFK
jgi:hypothetical protein